MRNSNRPMRKAVRLHLRRSAAKIRSKMCQRHGLPMNFKQLEAFQAIMRCGSATGAAERMRLSQSAISRLLVQLEEDLSLRLFVREKGRLTPTGEAFALVHDAKGLMDSAQCFRRHAEQLRLGGFKRRLLKVALPSTLATTLMPVLAKRFTQAHPDVVLEVLSGSYHDAERALLSRDADLGLVRLPTEMQGLTVYASLESEAVCIMPRGHALESLQEVVPTNLIDVSLVLLGRQRQTRQEIDMAFRHRRVQPRVVLEVHSVNEACAHVAQGLGVSIVNALLARHCPQDSIVSRPFRPQISYRLGIAGVSQAPAAPLHDTFTHLLVQAMTAAAPASESSPASARTEPPPGT